jgi:hypothetical protein
MASKKAKTPQEQALIKKRVEFVQSKPDVPKAQARQQFFVQTRAAELQAKGVEVTKQKRQELRQKFQSGEVKRSGFYTNADRARFATGNSGKGGTSSTSGTSTVNTGQNLAEYKMLSKENTARRPATTTKKQSSGGGFFAGAGNLAKRGLEDVANAPLIRFATRSVNSGLESTAATFINPSINLIGEGLNKLAFKKDGQKGGDYNPNLRVAGKMEAATNTVYALADIFTAGTTRALRIANPTFLTPPARTGIMTRINTKIDNLDNALNARTQSTRASKVKVPPAAATKTTTRPRGPVTTGKKPSNVDVTGPYSRPPVVQASKINPKPTRATTAKPAAAKPAAAKPAAARKTQAQMQKEADEAISGGLSKVMNEAPVTKGPDMNSSNLTFVEPKPAATTRARTQKPSGPRPAPKTTRAKAQAGSNFNQKVKNVNSGPQTKISPKIKKYESQEAFDKFMNSGGKDIVVEATRANPKVGKMFTDANEEFIKTRSARSASQAAVRAKRADRRVKAAVRLNRIRANQAAKAAGK